MRVILVDEQRAFRDSLRIALWHEAAISVTAIAMMRFSRLAPSIAAIISPSRSTKPEAAQPRVQLGEDQCVRHAALQLEPVVRHARQPGPDAFPGRPDRAVRDHLVEIDRRGREAELVHLRCIRSRGCIRAEIERHRCRGKTEFVDLAERYLREERETTG